MRERGIGASGSVRAQAADRASQFLSFLRMPVVAQIAEDRVRERRFGARSYLSAQAADHARQGPSFLRTPMLPRIPEDRVCERGLGERGSVSVHGAYRASQFPNLVCDCRPKIGTQRVTLVREELAKVPLSTCRPQAVQVDLPLVLDDCWHTSHTRGLSFFFCCANKKPAMAWMTSQREHHSLPALQVMQHRCHALVHHCSSKNSPRLRFALHPGPYLLSSPDLCCSVSLSTPSCRNSFNKVTGPSIGPFQHNATPPGLYMKTCVWLRTRYRAIQPAFAWPPGLLLASCWHL